MMFDVFVQHDRWVLLTLLAGTILTILLCLGYWALWRPREMETMQEQIRITGPISFLHWIVNFMPWVVILVILISIAYTITHLLDATLHLPNW
ncbi:hypothetical protein KJB30_06930 [Geobacter chapellei]|uniref:Uncharacterized protein n=2 Tax=Pelotalea chapellei TaxID=44671 RepID=A0ABS5U779_9BACT|nr:hypothetical protein [Pelotalea chapellei]